MGIKEKQKNLVFTHFGLSCAASASFRVGGRCEKHREPQKTRQRQNLGPSNHQPPQDNPKTRQGQNLGTPLMPQNSPKTQRPPPEKEQKPFIPPRPLNPTRAPPYLWVPCRFWGSPQILGGRLSFLGDSGVQGPPAIEGTPGWDVFDPAAVGDEAFLGHHLLEGVGVEFGEPPFLGDVDLGGKGNPKIGLGAPQTPPPSKI